MLSRLPLSRGFSLIELSIVLLIAGLLIAGVFSVTSNMQKQRTDQATANEVRTVVTALERYLVDNQGALTTAASPSLACTTTPLTCPKKALLSAITVTGHTGTELVYFQTNYLPGGLDLSAYKIGIANYGPITTSSNTNGGLNLRGLVIRNSINAADDGRLARIASLIGAQGGMIPASAIATAGGYPVTGVYGAWGVNTADYAIPAGSTAASQIAAYTASIDSQINTNLLSRINTGNQEANTMQTDLLANNGVGNTAASATTYQNSFFNVGGLGFMVTDALLNAPCNAAGATLNVFNSTGDTQIGSIKLGDLTSTPYNTTSKNLVVFGSSDTTHPIGGGAGYPSNLGVPALLQCVNTTANGWIWQLALSNPPTIPNDLTNSPSRVTETAYQNPPSGNNRTVNISNNCPTSDRVMYLFINKNTPATCGGFPGATVDVNVFSGDHPNAIGGAILIGQINPGSASSFIVPPGYWYYISSQGGLNGPGGTGSLPPDRCAATPKPCQWAEY